MRFFIKFIIYNIMIYEKIKAKLMCGNERTVECEMI